MKITVKPEAIQHNKPREHKSVAKPNGITKKGNKYKVTLDTHGKKVYIGIYKTLEHAEEALEKAKLDAET